MAVVLLYNISEAEKLQKLRFALVKLGIRARTVAPEEYAHPLGYLGGLAAYAPAKDAPQGGFSDEMLVMCGLSDAQIDALLSALRQARVLIALKAVLTPANAAWSSLQLHTEIAKEHEAMRSLRAKKFGKKAVHRKK